MKRKFYKTLLEWKNKYINTPIMVVGARQIGKTYLIEEFCKAEFEEWISINFDLHDEIKAIFEETLEPEEIVKRIEISLGRKIDIEKTVIFFDEIQVSERAISSLKYFCESKLSYKIICAGSLLGVKLRRFKSSFPVGKTRIEYMHPMDFEEFLLALDKQMWIDEIKNCYEKSERTIIHEKLMNLYRTYLCIGGMPEGVKNYIDAEQDILLFDRKIISNIIVSYLADMNKYTLNNGESIKIEKVYRAIPASLARESKEQKKFKYINIEKGANKKNFESSIDWLMSGNMIFKCSVVNDIQIPLSVYVNDNYFKLYINDIGLLTSILKPDYADILLNREFRFKGGMAENYVAQAFVANEIDLYYWTSGNEAEVDFLINNKDGIIPVEVKAGDSTRSRSLDVFMKKYKSNYAIRISAKNFGFENSIKSVPLYAVFCIQ
ncbi:MAG: ATP-binding protein [Lachnospiraceae bacterium]|nr:ATP-binding protein [Lachnospiraceae bacterium]